MVVSRPRGPRGRARHGVLALVFAAIAACTGDALVGDDAPPAAPVNLDPCAGRCNEAELCVADATEQYGCARICANQLHCWSGCCLPLDDTGYNVCRPTGACFPE
jgi:hypothetical protein